METECKTRKAGAAMDAKMSKELVTELKRTNDFLEDRDKSS